MKLAISNLAWDKSQDKKVLKLLKKYKIKGIEIAASKIWTNPTETTEKEIKKYRKFWNDNGIKIVATTSLLFGHPELQLFSDDGTRQKTLDYLSEMIRISSLLGAKVMVFGSPKNRITNGLPSKEVNKKALDFFRKIGKVAKKYKIYFGIEPNPPIYGTDFINTTQEAIDLVKKVNEPYFSLHLDTSTMTINKEDYGKTIKKALPFARHFHISEPGLKTIPQEETDYKKVMSGLTKSGYKNWVSIEMPLQDLDTNLEQIKKTLVFLTSLNK